jgi:hypothetical protein
MSTFAITFGVEADDLQEVAELAEKMFFAVPDDFLGYSIEEIDEETS